MNSNSILFCCYKNDGSYYTCHVLILNQYILLTNYVMSNRSVCIWIRILRCWLSCLCCRQVSASILSTSCCSGCISSLCSIWGIGSILCWTSSTINVLTGTILLGTCNVGWIGSWACCWWVGSGTAVWGWGFILILCHLLLVKSLFFIFPIIKGYI